MSEKNHISNKQQQELVFLQKLSKTVLSKEKLHRYLFLLKKRKSTELPKTEKQEYFKLIEEEQEFQLNRILILGDLSKLKGISIKELANELGIKPPPSV